MSSVEEMLKKQIEQRKERILSTKDYLSNSAEKIDLIKDKDWITKNFLVQDYTGPAPKSSEVKVMNRFYTSAEFKANDSSPGGSFEMNPIPQFTRYADPRIKGRIQYRKDVTVPEMSGVYGLGAYYSEAFDDNKQVIHIRPGVAEFNTWTAFFTNSYNPELGALARTGRDGSIMEKIGYAAGIVVSAFSFPLFMFTIIMGAASVLTKMQESKFYKLKGTPHLYWGTVNSLVNEFAIYSGLYPTSLSENRGGAGNFYTFDKDALANLSRQMPEIFSPSGGIDVYAISNRASRKKSYLDLHLSKVLEENENNFDEAFLDFAKKAKNTTIGNDENGFDRFMKNLFDTEPYKKKEKEGTVEYEKMLALDSEEKPPAKFFDFLKENLNDGAKFVSFRVQYTGSTSESFTNTTAKNDTQIKYNDISAKAKALNFTFAGGNVSGAIGAALDGAKALIQGVASSFNMENLLGLTGQAFIDIPRNWEDSSASLNKSSYKMVLTSHSGHPISQLINIWIPFFCIFALALPKAVGRQSYHSPPLVEFYDKGRSQSRLGIIDSLSVERGGATNLGYDSRGKAMSVVVSWTIADLSDVMSVPINAPIGFFDLDAIRRSFYDNESVFTDYMYSLAGVDMSQQVYWFSRLKLNFAKSFRALEQLSSSARYASIFGHSMPGIKDLDIIFKGQTR